MLEDIAYLNLGHYRNSADYEESCHISGQGYLVVDIGTMSHAQFKDANPSGITFGARSGLAGPGFKAQLLSMGENSMNLESMTKKEDQMRMIAAKMITPKTAQETAEGERIGAASEVSQLSIAVSNAESGLERMLRYACLFEGADPDQVKVRLNREFYPETMSPQEAVAMMQLFDRGIIDSEDVIYKAEKVEWVNPDRETERQDESGMINE